MIDKNGKVGGKINLIDLLIILVVIAGVGFVAFRSLRSNDSGVATEPVNITFYVENTFSHVVDQLETGTSVWDYSSNINVGTLESFTSAPFTAPVSDGKGALVDVPINGKFQATLNIKADGVLGPHGVTIDGQLYGVGHTLVMYLGECKVFASVSGIDSAA